MAPNDVRQQVREAAEGADELTVRLRVLDESGATVRLNVGVRPIGAAEDVRLDRMGIGPRDVNLGTLADGDIEALAFVVMMEAAKSAREDLKAIMEAVRSITDARHRIYDQIESARAGGLSTGDAKRLREGADLDAAFETLLSAYGTVIEQDCRQLTRDLDQQSELGEMESLRLQMAMDRLSKLMSTLSNLLKKAADTDQSIVSNLR